MLLTEEHVDTQVPPSSTERQKFISAQEKRWMSLSWDRKRFTSEQARVALTFLSAIAFSDHRDPIDLSHLSDDASSSRDAGSSADGGSSSQRESPRGSAQRGTKRPADTPPRAPHKSKKSKRSKQFVPISKGTQVACLDRSTSSTMWVLGSVSKYIPESKKYEVLDLADGEEQKYRVVIKNVRVIPKRSQTLDPEKPVLAVYPATTVFYPAKLISRKGKNWDVEFEGEEDDESNKIKEVDGRLILQDFA